MIKKQIFRTLIIVMMCLLLSILAIECGSRLKSKKCDFVMKGLCLKCNQNGKCNKLDVHHSKDKPSSINSLNDLNKVEDLLEAYDSSGSLLCFVEIRILIYVYFCFFNLR